MTAIQNSKSITKRKRLQLSQRAINRMMLIIKQLKKIWVS